MIGVRWRELADAVSPPVLAGAAMALVVVLAGRVTGAVPVLPRLALLCALGGATYFAWLLIFARGRIAEAAALIRRG